jgi:glutamate 5-kinase
VTHEIRDRIANAGRMVIKIGSSSLTRPGGGLDVDRIEALVSQIAERRTSGHQVVLVSSGAIATGFPTLGLKRRPRDLATQQAAASVGQGMLIAQYSIAFAKHGLTVGQVLVTAEDVFRLLDLGVVPIVNENDTVATDEIRFGDNDRLAALVAHVVQADALMLLSDVAGLYDGPPSSEGARLITDVRGPADLVDVRVGGTGAGGVGLGGMTTKVEAASIATAAGIPVLLGSAADMSRAMSTADVGTVFHPTGDRTSTRLLWLAHATTARGRLHLDAGAVAAVVQRRMSLLPAGITAVEGTFVAGDPVDLLDEKGHIVARGLVNFDAQELPSLLGRSTRELARELGPAYEREVVHRDALVILTV